MRRRLIRPGLPRDFHPLVPEGLLWAGDVRIVSRRLPALKVIVFKCRLHMRRFWKEHLKSDLTDFRGAVNYLSHTSIKFDKDGREHPPVRFVQPRYVAVMGLVKGFITYEIIVHECVHAAEAWDERFPNYPWPGAEDLPMESICYPAGKFACQIIKHLTLEGLMNKNPHE